MPVTQLRDLHAKLSAVYNDTILAFFNLLFLKRKILSRQPCFAGTAIAKEPLPASVLKWAL
ncbi:MAG: hypothetical protein ACX931_10445 [Saccharospirillum sp.]